jgi:hypothetical protein
VPMQPSSVSDAITERLARLESALTALKPQIETIVSIQETRIQAHEFPGQSGAQSSLEIPRVLAATTDLDNAENSPDLRSRRKMFQLQINTGPQDSKATTPPKTEQQAPPPAVVKVQTQTVHPPATIVTGVRDSGLNGAEEQNDRGGVDGASRAVRRAPTGITAIRVAPSALDPASPRSPGNFSAWK